MESNDRWNELRAHFDAIMNLELDQVHEYFDSETLSNQELRDELLALYHSHHDSASMPTTLNLNELVYQEEGKPMYEPGDRIGQYEISSLIESGGMGEVYLARRTAHYQEDLAIKIIHTRIATPAMVERFLRERQTLAMLNHPNICKILDGGTTDSGLPYIVMEYVPGSPITRYCRESGCGLRTLLKLFCSVCDAVSYAHRHLVIHRDIKPGNILVMGTGQVKLLDFGVSGVLEETTESDRFTPLTLGYSSPEQLLGEPLGTTTDIYSLGVVLYELLSGTVPHDLRGLMGSEAATMICKALPEPPSRRTSGTRFAPHALKGELDAIALQSIHPDPNARYQSIEHLKDDIQRYLEREPVTAFGSSMPYRLKKGIQRNKLAASLGAAIIVILLVSSAAVVAGFVRTKSAYTLARQEKESADKAVEFLQSMLAQANPYLHEKSMTVKEMLNRADEMIESELAARPDVAAEVRLAIGKIYIELFMYEQAIPYLERSYEHLLLAPSQPGSPMLADCMGLLARARSDLVWTVDVDCSDAVRMQQDVLNIRRETAGHQDAIASATADLALAHWAQDPDRTASEQVVELYSEALDLFGDQGTPDPSAVGQVHLGVGHAYASRGSDELAEHHFREAIRLFRMNTEYKSPFLLQSLNACAWVCFRTDRIPDAIELFDHAISESPEHYVSQAEIDARLGRLLCMAVVDPRQIQEGEWYRLLSRESAMYLQDSPRSVEQLLQFASADQWPSGSIEEVVRESFPVLLRNIQRSPRSVREQVQQRFSVYIRVFGKQWSLDTLDHALGSEALTERTKGELVKLRASLEKHDEKS